jgi:hypothetical protein
MDTGSALEFIFRILRKPNLFEHINAVGFSSSRDKWKVEVVSIICRDNSWSSIAKVSKETAYYGGLDRSVMVRLIKETREKTDLIKLIEDSKLPLVLRPWSVLEIIDVFADNFSIGNEEALFNYSVSNQLRYRVSCYLAIDHIGNHHDLIV